MNNWRLPVIVATVATQAGAQPCEPGWVYEPARHWYHLQGPVHDLVEFNDGSGAATFAAVEGDTTFANFLRLTGDDVTTGGLEPIGLRDESPRAAWTMHVFDADGAGPQPPMLYAGGGVGCQRRIWRYDGEGWEALPDRLPLLYTFTRDIIDYDDGSGPALYITGSFGTNRGERYAEGPYAIARWDEAEQKWAQVGGGIWREEAIATENVGRVMAVYDEDGAGGARPALFVGGTFDRAGGTAVTSLARWDGAEYSAVGELTRDDGALPTVTSLFVHDDGSGEALYVGGTFHEADGVRSPGLVRWDGKRFSALGGGLPTVGPPTDNAYARALTTWREGGRDLLLVGGLWRRSAPAPEAFHAPLLLWDGASWRPLTTQGDAFFGNGILAAHAAVEDGRQILYVAGDFKEIDGRNIKGVARWDGERWSGYETGLGSTAWRIRVFDDGAGPKLLLPPQTSIDDRFTRGLTSWDGVEYAEYHVPGVPAEEAVSTLWTVAKRAGRDHLYLWTRGEPKPWGFTGLIWEYDGGRASVIAEVNTLGTASGSAGLHVVEHDDGSGPALYMASIFGDVEGECLGDVLKWAGDRWVAVGEGVRFSSGPIPAGSRRMKVLDDGTGPTLYIAGGNFRIGGDKTTGGIARWDGEKWQIPVGDYTLPAPHSGRCWDLEIYDGRLHAALALVHPIGYILPGVARLDGETWTVLGLTSPESGGSIRDMHVFDDGFGEKLYIGGNFLEIDGVPCRGAAIWDGKSWAAMSGGTSEVGGFAGPRSMATFDAGDGADLYIGGEFKGVLDDGGRLIPTGHLARWGGCRDSCPADLTGDGRLDFADFLAFQNLFAAMDPRADFDGDSAFTFFDFLAFQDAFAAGCP